MVNFESVLSAWKPYAEMEGPPDAPVKLWGTGGCAIWVSDSLGPVVPYPPVDHGDGNVNHGYMRLKGSAGAVSLIPEAQGWPEMQEFLETINAGASPLESVGCEKGFFAGEEGAPRVKLGSYVDVIFTEAGANDRPADVLRLACRLANAIEDCEKWWGDVSFALQRMRALPGASRPWGLELNVKNYGRSEDEARKFWGVSLSRLGEAIAALPQVFR